jgi:hypothetical protein
MIKVIDINDKCENANISIDDYIPFSIEYDSSYFTEIFYWRGGDGKLSLVEIGIIRQTGTFKSIVLTNINQKDVIQYDKVIPINLFTIEGQPICDLSKWNSTMNYSDTFIDEFDLTIKLLVGLNFISLIFSNTFDIARYIQNNNIRFGIASDGSLITIDILDLSENKIEILRKYKFNKH